MNRSPMPRCHRLTAMATTALALLALLAGCATAPPPPPAPAVVVVEVPPPAVEAPAPELQPPPPEVPVVLRPLQPRNRALLDPLDDSARGDLWARVRAGLLMPDLDNDLVRKWEQYYASKPEYMQRMSARGARYLFHIVEEIDRRNMPTDLALLPFIESAFDPQALSVARAAGMWQFMPGTGKDFELRQNLFRDDRRDIIASTRAALDYLQMLHKQFGDWHLALAAYNWGQGNVQKALARNRKAGLPTDYASLRMPDETRNYVPKLQAVKNIVVRPESFAIALPPLEDHPYFIGVQIERDIDVELAAAFSGLTLEQFQQLNPQMNKPVILAAGTPQVLLPYDNANRFLTELKQHRGPLASWTAWVAPKTLTPAEASRQVGMTEARLREVNRIPARMLIKAGSTLLVLRGAHATADVAGHIAEHATMALAPERQPGRQVRFVTGKRGEAVSAVARRYGVSAASVATANGVSANGHFKAGQTVLVQLPAAAAKASRVATAPKAARKSHPARPTARTAATPKVRVAQR